MMRKICLFQLMLLCIGVFFSHAQTNYFYKGSGSISTTTNWGTNTNGTGTAPANFTNGDIFNLRNVATIPTLTANWTVSGTNSKVVVGDGSNTCTLTIPSGFTITATIDVANNATLSIANATNPSLGNLYSGSTVNFSGSISQNIPAANFFNLTSSSSGARVLVNGGTIGIAGAFTTGTNSYTNTGNTITFNGTTAQSVPGFTFNNLTIQNTNAIVSASGAITVNNTLNIVAGAVLDMGTRAFTCGTTFSSVGTGTLATGVLNSSGAINTNGTARTFNGTVMYNGNGNQTLPQQNNTFTNLTIANTGGVAGLFAGTTINGLLTINSGCTLNAGGNALSGNFTTSGTGILTIGNTSSTPITSGLTYSFDVYYNSSSSQTIVGGTYNGILNTTGGNRTLSSTGNVVISTSFIPGAGTFTSTGSTVNFAGTSSQTIPALNYANLVITNATNTIYTAGNLSVSSSINIPSGVVLDMGSNQLTGSFTTSGTGTLLTACTTNPSISTGRTFSFSVKYYAATGGQSIAGTFNNGVTISNTSGINSAAGGITVNGNIELTYAGSTLNMGTSIVTCGTPFTTTGLGTLSTQYTSGSGALTTGGTGRTWNFKVVFNGASSQTLPQGTNTFKNLTIATTGGVAGLYGSIIVTDTLTIISGSTLNAGTATISGSFTSSGTGTLTTSNTSSSPLPSGISYPFDVYYNSASSQTIVGANYNAALNTTGGNRSFSTTDTVFINSTFTTGSGTFSANNSTVCFSGNRTLPSISFYNLVISSGTAGTPTSLTISNDLTLLSSAIFTAPSDTLKIGDDFTNNGVFNHNNGTVHFNGSSQHVYGNTTFYHFTKSVSAADIITFQSNATQSILGKLTLKGSSGNLLSVYASSINAQATINPSGVRDVNYVAVSGMNNTNAAIITTTNSLNYGNNTNWSLGTANATGDLEAVPSTWSCTKGSLLVDTNHYRLGYRSVGWKWKANDTLKITSVGFDSTLLFNFNYNTLNLSIYNTALRNDSIQFLFYNRNKVLRYSFSVRLNYKGWYETIRSYRYNMYKPAGSSTTDSLMTVFIVAPKSDSGQLDFDRVNWINSRQTTLMTLMMPDSIIKTAGGYPSYDDNTMFNLTPNIPASIPSNTELTEYNAIKTSFLNDLLASAVSVVNTTNVNAANTFYNSNNYMLNSDGTAKGKPIFGFPQGASGNFVSFTKYLQVFAYKWALDNTDTVSLNKALVMLRYFLDNGNFGGGCYKMGFYDVLEFYTAVAVMADKVYAADTTLYNGLGDAIKWQLRFGAAWMPASVYSPLTTDNLREEITGYLTYPLFYQRDNAKAIQHLKGFNQLLSTFMAPNDGIEDNVKVDGAAFHHGANYYGYVEPCYSNLSNWLFHLRNTQFKPDALTYKRIRDVAYLYFLEENTFESTYGNKCEASSSTFNSTKLSRLAQLGAGITGSGPDFKIGCAYNRLFPTNPNPDLPIATYPTEDFPSGFYQLNYATLGIYRQKNWLSTIKMLSQDFWGSECGLVGDNGTRRDIYSRYLGYGSIDIQYSGGFDSSGYTADAYKYTNGYDHRFPNGATTIVLPMDSLEQNENFGKEYGNTGSIAASLSFNNRKTDFAFKIGGDYGLSAMNFRQAPYGFQGGCRGVKRDTNFVFQKSWFAFDSILVCLGSGIKNKQTNYTTATNIFQLTDSAQTLYINGTANSTFNYKADFKGTGPYRLISPYNTGYYIKSNDSLHIAVTKQTFNLDINGTPQTSTGNWANVWLDHGKSPVNKSYQYVILPSTTPAALNQFADSMANPSSACYTVKKADSQMHYVYYKPLKIQAYAIFKPLTNYTDTESIIKSVNDACYAMCMNVGDTVMKCTFVNPNPNLQTSLVTSPIVAGQYVEKSIPTALTITLRGPWAIQTADTSVRILTTTDSTTIVVINTQYSLPNDVVFVRLKVPEAPTIDSVIGGNQQAIVYFTPPSNNGGATITNYTVTPYINGLSQTTRSGTTSPITITGLTNGTAYTFTVFATNLVGKGVASTASSAVTPATVPNVPNIVSVIGGNQQVTVSFNAPSSNGGATITSYSVIPYINGVAQPTTTGSASPIIVTGLTNGTTYTFAVFATNRVGNGAISSVSFSVTPATVPEAPTNVSVTSGNQQVSISFTAPSSNGGASITNYTVTPYINGVAQVTTIGATSPIIVSGLTNGTAYTFTVYASSSVGNGTASAASLTVTPATVPSVPTNVSVLGGNQQATVSFSRPSNNGGASVINYTVTPYINGIAQATTSATSNPILISGLTNGIAYTFTVYATNSVGNGAESAATSAVTPSNNYTWTGVSSSNWNDASNWIPTLPPSTASVFISKTGSNDLSIETSPTVASLSIAAGNNVKLLNGQILTLNGNFSNSGSFNALATSTILIASTDTISGTGNTQFNNLTINAGAILTLGTISISGTITNNGTFNTTNGSVTFNGTSAQKVPGGTYSYLSIANASVADTAIGNITVANGINISKGATLDMGVFQLVNNGLQYVLSTTRGGLQNTTSVTVGANSNIGVGQQVSGSFIPDGTVVNSVSTAVVATTTTSSTGATNPIIVASATGIVVGQAVLGNNIPANVTVTAVSGTFITLSSAPTATITGNITFSVTNLTLSQAATAANGNTGIYFLVFGAATTGTGTLNTQNTSTTPINSAKAWTFTVNYNSASGTQTIPLNSIFYGLTINNSFGNVNAGNNFSVYGNLAIPNANNVLDMRTAALNCMSSAFTTSGSGTLITQNYTSGSGAINTNSIAQTWNFTVVYAATLGGQTLPRGVQTFNNLTIANTSGVVGLFNSIIVNGVLTINTGSILNTGGGATSTITGNFTTSGNGILQVASTVASPLPSGKTYSFEVDYVSNSAQTIVPGNYSILNASAASSGNRTLPTGKIAISSLFVPGTTGTYTIASGDTLSLAFTGLLNATLGTNAVNYVNLAITGGTVTAPTELTILGSLNINGGTFVAPSGYFNVGGNWTNTGGSYSANGGTVIFNGTSLQTISGISSFNNLVINNLSGVTLNDSLYLTGTLTPTSGTLNTNGLLVLKSTATSTAQIATGTSNYLNGNVTVERFIPNKTARKYSFVASPISQTIRNTWQKQIYITGSGNGGQPCGNTSGNGGSTDRYNSNGFDNTLLNTPSMYTYQATPGTNGSRWVTIANTIFTNIEIGKGYRVNIRGNRNSTTANCNNQLNSNIPNAPEAVTLSTYGNVTTGSVTVSLNNPATHRYTLLGNPYPSTISFSALYAGNSTSITNKMWTYSPFSNGSYTTYSNGLIANGATGYDNTSGDYIASGQAFFVESNPSSNGSITFQEQYKTSGQIPNVRYFGTANQQLIRISLQSNDSTRLDEAVVRFNSFGAKQYQADWDAVSFGGGAQSIAVIKANSHLSISTFPETTATDTIPLVVKSNQSGSFNLAFSNSIDSTVFVTLLDQFLGTQTQFGSQLTYPFNVTSDTNSWGDRRFAIVLKKQSVVLPLSFVQASIQILDRYPSIKWKTNRKELIKEFIVEKSSNGVDFKTLYRTNQTEFIDTTLFSGLAYYRIAALQKNGEIGYSNIVSIRPSTMEQPSFQLFPNPVVGTNAQLKLIHVEAGKYRLAVCDNLGKSVLETAIVHEGGTAVYPILLRPYLSKGMYQIRIQKQGEVGIIFHQKLFMP